MKEELEVKRNTIIDDNNNNLESIPIKPFHKTVPESKLSEATLNNSSDIDLCQESKSEKDIDKSNDTIALSSRNSLNNHKKKTSKDTITIEESENSNITKRSSLSSKKNKSIPSSSSSSSSIQDSKKKLKNDRSSRLNLDKTSTTIHKTSKISKPSPPVNSSIKPKPKTNTNIQSNNVLFKASKNSPSTTDNKTIMNNNNNSNSSHLHSTSSISNIPSILQRKSSSSQISSLDINKRIPMKPSNPPGKMSPLNKSISQSSKKLVKPEIRKTISFQNEVTNRLEKNKQYNDYINNKNSSQLKLKKPIYSQKENQINEKEIVLKSNEYRKAVAKINSLEKTIKQLQAQHSETLSCLHSEIARLQRACSEKTLSEAFKGTGLLTSLSANNLINNKPALEKSNSLNSSNDSLDQDILIQTLNNLPKGMNLLPKIKKPTEDINKISEDNIKNNNESKESLFKEEDKILNNSSDINKIKSNIEYNEKMNNIKKKTSGNIRAHKYHAIDKHDINMTDHSKYSKSSLSEGNIMSDSSGSYKKPQSFVSLSEASAAVVLSSDHASLSSLIKSDITLKESKNDFINNIKANSKLALSLNRQLPPPLPPNYARSNKTSESPRRLINLPKIIQPIVKIKENKNTSINLPSLINNKTTKK